MCAFGVELTLPVHSRARQDPYLIPYAGGWDITTGHRAAGRPPGDPWGVPRVVHTRINGVGKGNCYPESRSSMLKGGSRARTRSSFKAALSKVELEG